MRMEVVSKDRKTKAENPISDLHLVPKIMLAHSYDPFVATMQYIFDFHSEFDCLSKVLKCLL
jgi:hypothetical protein